MNQSRAGSDLDESEQATVKFKDDGADGVIPWKTRLVGSKINQGGRAELSASIASHAKLELVVDLKVLR
ncbi:hypothetical protein FRC00_009076, partial [Tulasnella sp. 408]